MIFLIIFLIILLLYIIFIFAPAVVIYLNVFGRKQCGAPLSERDLTGTRYEPYMDELLSAERYITGVKGESLTIKARDGVKLRGLYLDNKSDKSVIFAHGYRGAPVSNFCVQAEHLDKNGFNLLFITQRAHGESGGRRLGLGCLEQYDLLEWIRLEAARENVKSIAVYGSSMGAAAVGYASDKISEPKVKALVIDCGFSSPKKQLVRDSKIRHLPYPLLIPIIRILAKAFIKIDIYSRVPDSLKNTKIPALFIHGTADETVPIEQGRENFQACASQKEFIAVEGAQHILAYVTGGENTKSKVNAFIKKHTK